LRSRGRHTPFEGYSLPARVRLTLVGGQIAHEG
jgi:dihydroorotase